MSAQLKETNRAEQQAQAQLESIVEMARALNETPDSDDREAHEDAERTIQEDPLSLQVRGDWHTPGEEPDGATEFELLLCTGGPAVRIVGDLDAHNQPERPRIQYQDWGTPWTEYFPTDEQREALQTYCEQFYYGE